MNDFLDKVGLQHFVEKIKGLLSGYLPLSGGTMTGDIVYTGNATLNGNELNYNKVSGSNIYTSFIKPNEICVSYTGSDDTYGEVSQGFARLFKSGLYISMISSKNAGIATFTAQKCQNNIFVLSKKDRDDSGTAVEQVGLIANNSTTVVKELSADQVSKILRNNDASSITGKHYLSEKGLATLSKDMYARNSKTIIQTNADTVLYLEAGEVSNNIPAYTNVCINSDSWNIEDPDSIISVICRGFVDVDALIDNLRYIRTFDARDSYLCSDNLSGLFTRCAHLTNVDIADWNTDKVTSCESMFRGCSMIQEIDLSHWDTRNITSTRDMFSGCTNLRVLNLDGWNTQSVETMQYMFEACGLITTLNLGPGFGRMKDSVGTLDLSPLERWTDSSVQDLTKLYDRKANGLGVITIKLSVATKNALGTSGIQTLTAKGYTIA